MSNPTWQNVLTSALNRSALKVSIPKAVPVEVTFPGQPSLEDRVIRLEERVDDLEEAHQRSLCIILIVIDLRLAYVADSSIAKLLRASGIEDPVELSGQDSKALHERMERENKKRRFMGSVPPVEQVASLVRAVELASQWAPSGGQSGAADS